jgi:pyruvate dehydrogenase phosphatase
MFVVQTPPYLTALPEISYHRLTARDKFMVIGSDGLWDMMTPMQVLESNRFLTF